MRVSRRLLRVLAAVAMVGLAVYQGQAASAGQGLPVRVLVQGPAETDTELQIFCLFRPAAEHRLQGSLLEIDTKLHGLLGEIRRPGLFGGELGETMLLVPAAGTVKAKRLLILGLGDAATFTPERMYLVGKIALQEANRVGVAHPFFAPTILDGGVTGFSTGAVSEQVVRGFQDALATLQAIHAKGSGGVPVVEDVVFLAGATHAAETQSGIDRALGK